MQFLNMQFLKLHLESIQQYFSAPYDTAQKETFPTETAPTVNVLVGMIGRAMGLQRANLDTWSNIASAYYNNDMRLFRRDSIPAEVDIEPSECEAIFPNCQKCKFAHKCSAYQDALSAQDTTSRFFISEDGFSLMESDDK